jgi:hypothetical protein
MHVNSAVQDLAGFLYLNLEYRTHELLNPAAVTQADKNYKQ